MTSEEKFVRAMAALEAQGVRFAPSLSGVRVTGADRLTDKQRDWVRRNSQNIKDFVSRLEGDLNGRELVDAILNVFGEKAKAHYPLAVKRRR